MKKIHSTVLAFIISVVSTTAFAQNVAINEDGSAANPNAILDVKSFNKGVLLPRTSTVSRQAIPNTKGLLVYDTTTGSFWYNSGTGWQNLAGSSNAWSLNGNSISDTVSFIGNTFSLPLQFKIGGQPAGRIDPFFPGNTLLGFKAGAIMPINSNGRLFGNTAIGAFSLSSNSTGSSNTATGFQSLNANTTAFNNTANGSEALENNTTGVNNTAIGSEALKANTTGLGNTATGVGAMLNNITGGDNTANGASALSSNTTGVENTAVGSASLVQHVSGNLNTAIGYQALFNDSAGTQNTALGALADVSRGVTNGTAIGYRAIVNASNKVRIGNSAVTVIEGQVPFTTPSDGRFKYHVQEDVKGLDFILHLRPVTYQFDVKRFDQQKGNALGNEQATPVSYAQQASYDEAAAIRRSGFIAQEVEKAADASGYNFSGIIRPKTEQEHYSLSYESFVVPLVKAVQEQQLIISAQNEKIASLQQDAAKNREQLKQLAELQQQVAELSQLIHSLKTK